MEKTLKAFNPGNPTLSKDIAVDGQAWIATCSQAQTFPLFEIANLVVEAARGLFLKKPVAGKIWVKEVALILGTRS